MSEQPPEGARRDGQPGQRGQGKKILGLPRGQAIGLGLVALGGLAFLLWRARKNAQAAQQQAQTSSCPDGSTPDANGNCPQNSQDWSGAIDTLQSEIAALQGAQGAGAGGGTAGSVGAATGTSTVPPTTAPVTTGPAPSTQAPPPKTGTAGPVSNLQATQTGSTSFTVRWNPASGATGGYEYIVRDLASHQPVGQPHRTKSTSATVTGLKPRTDYNFGVQGLPGGPGDNLHVRTK